MKLSIKNFYEYIYTFKTWNFWCHSLCSKAKDCVENVNSDNDINVLYPYNFSPPYSTVFFRPAACSNTMSYGVPTPSSVYNSVRIRHYIIFRFFLSTIFISSSNSLPVPSCSLNRIFSWSHQYRSSGETSILSFETARCIVPQYSVGGKFNL